MSTLQSSKNSTIKNFFEAIDFTGKEPKLLTKQKNQFKTVFGGILSLLIYMIIAAATFYFGQELYLKQHPITVTSVTFDVDPPVTPLTFDNFALFVGLEDSSFNYYIDNTIVNVSIQFVNQSAYQDGNDFIFKKENINIPLQRCNLTENFPNFQDLFSNFNLKNLLCIKPEAQEKLQISGAYSSSLFQYINIILATCKNGTEVVCKSQEEIDAKINGGYFVVDTINSIFNPANYTFPKKNIIKDYFTTISNKYYKKINYYMKRNDFKTDSGFLMSEYQETSYLGLDTIEELFDFRQLNSFLEVHIRMSNNRDIYTRSYVKLQDVIAQMGGLVKGVILILTVILYTYTELSYSEFIINYLYPHSQITEKKLRQSPIRLSKKQSLPLEDGQLKSEIHSRNNFMISMDKGPIATVLPSNISNVKKLVKEDDNNRNIKMKTINNNIIIGSLKKDRKIKVKLNNFDRFKLIFTYFCSSKDSVNKKTKNFFLAKEIIEPKFELLEIIKLFNIVNALKAVLLNNEQRIILKSVTDDLNINISDNNSFSNLSTFNEAKIKLAESTDPIDKRIIELALNY